jgi:hypothetical protein
MSALLFRTRVAVLWVAVAVAMSGSLLLFLYAPGAVEEMLAGTMEGETLSDAWTFLFAAVGAIPLVMAVVTLLVSDRANRYVNLVAGLAYGLLSTGGAVLEVLGGHFDGHVVMSLTAGVLALLIGGISTVGLRQPASPETEQGRSREGANV